MSSRIHVSCPSEHKNPQLSRMWILPNEFKESVVKLLGGNPYQPNSLLIHPGYLTQSLTTVPLPKILKSLGREYIELPAEKEIDYKQAILQGGFEYLFEKRDGAWKFTRIIDILLNGYTSERIDPLSKRIHSIGDMRKSSLVRHDGGPRYLIKYHDSDERWADLYRLCVFEKDTESAQATCRELDELNALIF